MKKNIIGLAAISLVLGIATLGSSVASACDGGWGGGCGWNGCGFRMNRCGCRMNRCFNRCGIGGWGSGFGLGDGIGFGGDGIGGWGF